MNIQQISKKFDTVTLKKMGTSALLLVGGALATFLLNNIVEILTAFNIPESWFPATMAVCTWGLNTFKEWLSGTK